MDRILEKPSVPIILLFVIAAYLFFFRLGDMALTDPDEVFYAQTAKEMLGRGEWLTPYLYDKPQFEKPILFYWLAVSSFKIFGINEFAARFPSAVFGLIGIITVYFLGQILFNKRVGLFSALILATNVEYIMLSRACVTDMVLSTFILLGLTFFFYGHIRDKGIFYLLSAAALALATLTKGPIGVILPVFVIIIYLFLTKDLKIFKKGFAIFWTILIFLMISVPWHFLMYRMYGKGFTDVFFGFHNITRFLVPEHAIGSQFYYYIPIVLVGFFPWSAFLPYGFWHALKRTSSSNTKERRHSMFTLLWFAAIFIFFSASSTKLPTYVFPSFAALALIVAYVWDDFLTKGAASGVGRGPRFSYYLLLTVIALGAIGLYLFIKFDYPTMVNRALISSLFLIFGFVLSMITFVNKRFLASFAFIVYSVAIFLYPLNKLVIPEIERYESSREISQKLLSLIKGNEAIGAERGYVAGVTFYTGRIVTNIDIHNIFVKFLEQDERVWCILKEKNFRQLYELDDKPHYTKPSYMVYKLGKKCIITNKVPEDGVYLAKRERSK